VPGSAGGDRKVRYVGLPPGLVCQQTGGESSRTPGAGEGGASFG